MGLCRTSYVQLSFLLLAICQDERKLNSPCVLLGFIASVRYSVIQMNYFVFVNFSCLVYSLFVFFQDFFDIGQIA
jgi:hypothetical protein